jgi:hypothetical protein
MSFFWTKWRPLPIDQLPKFEGSEPHIRFGIRHASICENIMTAIVMTSDFAGSAKLRVNHSRLKKAIAAALFLACLFGARGFAEEKASFAASFAFAPLKAQSALGFYFLDFRTLWPTMHFPSSFGLNLFKAKEKVATVSDWSAGLSLNSVRPFESLPLDLFQPHWSRFSRFEPGLGSYFPDDTIGRSRISGAGLEENRWLYLKVKFKF